jgi:hypothetical protein
MTLVRPLIHFARAERWFALSMVDREADTGARTRNT